MIGESQRSGQAIMIDKGIIDYNYIITNYNCIPHSLSEDKKANIQRIFLVLIYQVYIYIYCLLRGLFNALPPIARTTIIL